ncbi:hypothetical protein NBRC10512_004613 [Rhodotorula toruloides]|uniref:RHTO0S10e02586g1_1 n=2 Tax=Rhodotorula toruloides TaxID=5286 RepID=A0A061BAH5_RHOTO|nr:uncharacterized protein RHTO_05409 [Rhodotorula toruloides NP11]EMS19037.1 hypothetical protein RHTO_05409 [Rhodotorula toruloides NP11]CDR44889.1 RHTO0S10e02586g1_1 [Rhodotorula toruloides]
MSSPAPSTAARSTLNPFLPSPRLPLELMDLIIHHCDEPLYFVGHLSDERLKTLATLSRVSRYFAERAQPALFKRIVVEYPINLANLTPAGVRLLDTLEDKERLRAAVRAFDIHVVLKTYPIPIRDSFKRSLRRRFLKVFQSLSRVEAVTYHGSADAVPRVKMAMWKCLPSSTQILDLLNFEITPDEVFRGFNGAKRIRANPLSVLVDSWHIARYRQVFPAGGAHQLDFMDLTDARSPYVQRTT